MNQLVLALQAALVLVIFLILIELLRLQRAVRSAQLTLPNLDEVRRMNETIRSSSTQAEKAGRALTESLEKWRAEARREEIAPQVVEPDQRSASAVKEPEAPPKESSTRRGPRILSEAGRAKFDRVLHLAAQGLDIDSIASEVDLTRAEIELMLGSVS